MKLLFFGTPASKDSNTDRMAVQAALRLNRRSDVRADLLDLHAADHREISERAETLRTHGTAVAFMGLNGERWHPLEAPARVVTAAARLRTILHAGRYECVLTDSSNPATCLAGALACVTLPTRHVMGVHGDFGACTWIRQPLFNTVARSCLRWHTEFYGVSARVVDSWITASRTPPHRSRVVYNAIGDDFFTSHPDRCRVREELDLPRDARLLLFAGRLTREKGVSDLLDVVSTPLMDRDAYLLLVGEAPDRVFLREVQARLAREPWDQRVRVLGYRHDIPRLMASSDALVLPTRWEGFGLVLAEALACGLPIVATHVGGVPEVLAQTGVSLIPPRDPDALRRAILAALDLCPADRETQAAHWRACATRYTGDRRAADLYDLVCDVVMAPSRRRHRTTEVTSGIAPGY